MLMAGGSQKIFLATAPVDMRSGFDSLAARVLQSGLDLYGGHLFVFVSRRRTHLKVLAWDRNGLVLFYKRIEKGRFYLPEIPPDARTVSLDGTTLAMLLDGIDIRDVRRSQSWSPRSPGIDGEKDA
jgi:transposase